MKYSAWLWVFVFFLASASVYARQTAASPPANRQTAASPPVAASPSANEKAGERLYLQRCAACHSGTAPLYETYGPPVNGELITRRGEERMRTLIMEGSTKMPGFRYTLNEAQVTNILTFLKTLKDSNWR